MVTGPLPTLAHNGKKELDISFPDHENKRALLSKEAGREPIGYILMAGFSQQDKTNQQLHFCDSPLVASIRFACTVMFFCMCFSQNDSWEQVF
jgi:hypothetical protein